MAAQIARHGVTHLQCTPSMAGMLVATDRTRDALRGSPALASEYADLKTRLAAQFRHDREAYTQAKSPFVQLVLSRAGVLRQAT